MKFIINITLAAFITMCCIPAKGQTVIDPGTPVPIKDQVTFTYDNAGNRITRTSGLISIPVPKGEEDDEINPKSGELPNENETLENSLQKLEIQVYPNPVKDELMIDIWNGVEKENYRLNLFDMTGKLVFEQIIESNGRQVVDFNSYKSGTYLLVINAGKEKFQFKIIKEN